jgi:neutral ceramidase
MEDTQDLKAGPLEEKPRFTETQRWRGRINLRLVFALVLIFLACVTFLKAPPDNAWGSWGWDLYEDGDGGEAHHESSKGSKYLLGVGKADITG